MTDHEYKQWLANHLSYFPKLTDWMNRQTEPQQAKIRELWRREVLPIEYDLAVDATAKLYAASIKRPIDFGQHPGLISEMAARRAKPTRTPPPSAKEQAESRARLAAFAEAWDATKELPTSERFAALEEEYLRRAQ